MQKRVGGIIVGLLGDGYPSYTLQLIDGATWMAYGFNFNAAANKTLNKVTSYVSAVTGSPTISCDLVGQTSSGLPDYSNILDSATTLTITSTGVKEWTGFTYELTPGVQYYILFKNTHETPATNNITMRYPYSAVSKSIFGDHVGYSISKNSTANSGTSWSTSAGVGCLRVEFSDGSVFGMPFHNVSGQFSPGQCYGAGQYQSGAKFRTPANATLRVAGVTMRIYRANSPTGDLKAVLRFGATVVESITVPASKFLPAGHSIAFFFTSIQEIPPNTDVIVSLKNTATDSSMAYYAPLCAYVFDDAASKGLLPFADGVNTFWQRVYTTDSGSTWTADNTTAPLIALILDSAGEFGQTNQGRRYRR
jgi:hypothetical protein